jgi:hypothetical protein
MKASQSRWWAAMTTCSTGRPAASHRPTAGRRASFTNSRVPCTRAVPRRWRCLGCGARSTERMPSLATYTSLRAAAEAVDAWDLEREAARAALRRRDPGGLVDALLSDGDAETAWEMAVADPDWDPGRIGGCAWPKLARPTGPPTP